MKVVIDSESSLLTFEVCHNHNAPPYQCMLHGQQKGIPVLHRFATPEDLERLTDSSVFGPAPPDSITERATTWIRNHMYSSPIINLKFSCRGTMCGLLDHGNRITEEQMERHRRFLRLSESDDDGDDSDSATESEAIQGEFIGGQETNRDHLQNRVPMSQDSFFLNMDMSPVDKIGRILDEDISSGTNRYRKAVVVAGAFHKRMQTLDCANESNHDTAEWLVSGCYGRDGDTPTDKNLSYFFNFSDPTIPEIQVNAILTAIYAYAMRCMRKAKE